LARTCRWKEKLTKKGDYLRGRKIFAPAKSQTAASSLILATVVVTEEEVCRKMRAFLSSQIYQSTRRLHERTREASAAGRPAERPLSQSTAREGAPHVAGSRERAEARVATLSQIRRACGHSTKRCKQVSRFRMQRGQK
jgi:hypothetical protein